MTRIALMRHYPTAWNAEARLQGHTDIPLTDKARETLAALRMPAPWDRAHLIASPLSRASQTAHLLAEGRDVAHSARIIELSWGEWEGALAKDLLRDPATGFRPTHEWDRDTAAPGGESMAQAWDRVRPLLAEIASQGEAAVLVTHKALMRVILGIACDWQGMPEIKRGRLYPLTIRPSGLPRSPEPPVRLEARSP
ncbi:MAG: histidine phosphatase family protein [Pseudomonadota bacterium]